MGNGKKSSLVGINVGLIMIMASQMLPSGPRIFGLILGVIATGISTRNYIRLSKVTAKRAGQSKAARETK